MTMEVKSYQNCKLSPKNIRIRFEIAKMHGENLNTTALKFGLIDPEKYELLTEFKSMFKSTRNEARKDKLHSRIKQLESMIQNGRMRFSRFMNTGKWNMIVPDMPKCGCCGKSLADNITDWINDGSLNDTNLRILKKRLDK